MNEFKTEQERFWASDFGDAYSGRNESPKLLAANIAFFSKVVESCGDRALDNVLELGANIGMNLRALNQLLPNATIDALEINSTAVAKLRTLSLGRVFHGSLLNFERDRSYDLVFTKGVLIHIDPEFLAKAYDVIESAAARFVLIAEYYNPSPVTITYRGHDERLYKRDFAGEFMERFPNFALRDYGFLYHRDRNFPQDDITWFLLERSNGKQP